MRRRIVTSSLAIALMALLAAIVVPGASPSRSTSGAASGTLTIGIGQDFGTLDIRGLGSAASFSILRHITEPLVAFSPTGKFIPDLATSWQQVTPTKLRFHLRQGVRFTNGDPFDAATVKHSIAKVLDPKFAAWDNSYIAGLVKSVTIVNRYTVDVNEVSPTTRLIDGLTTVDMVDPTYDATGKMKTHPIGTGPYEFVSFTPRQQLVLQRNPTYWGKRPAIAKIVVRIIPDPSTQAAALLRGEVQMVNNLPFSFIDQVKKHKGTTVATGPSARLVFLAINTKKAPLDNPLVRQALNYAVNKSAIVQSILKGQASVANGPCAPLTKYCRTDLGYAYNVEKAKSLLKEAGYSGQPITLTIGAGRYPNDDVVGQAVVSELQAAGFNAKLNTIDYSSLGSQLSAGHGTSPFDMWLQGWSADDNDLIGMLQALFTKDAVYPIGYNNAKVTSLLNQASHTVNAAVIQRDLSQAEAQIAKDAPVVFMYVPKQDIGISTSLKGFTPRFDEYFFFWDSRLS